jgi:hypothetical protein
MYNVATASQRDCRAAFSRIMYVYMIYTYMIYIDMYMYVNIYAFSQRLGTSCLHGVLRWYGKRVIRDTNNPHMYVYVNVCVCVCVCVCMSVW